MDNALTDPKDIELYRLKILRAALKLELYGMHRSGKSAYAVLKDEFGYTGKKAEVFEAVSKRIFEEDEKREKKCLIV
jgi:hypothetical protein